MAKTKNSDDFDLSSFDVIKRDVERDSTGVAELDEMMGGGWPKGYLSEIYGREGSGKTTICFNTIAAAQAKGQKCLFIDAEGGFNAQWAELHGVDLDKLMFYDVLNHPDGSTAEAIFNMIEKMALGKKCDVIVLDSIASLVTDKEFENDYEDVTIGALARFLSMNLKKLMATIKNANITLIFINQVRESMNMGGKTYGDNETTPGGRAVKHCASIRLKINSYIPNKTDKPEAYQGSDKFGDIVMSKLVKVKTKKSRFFPQNREVEFMLKIVKRNPFDQMLLDCIDKDIVVRSPKRHKNLTYVDNGGTEHKIVINDKCDMESLAVYLNENKLLFEIFEKMGQTQMQAEGFLKDKKIEQETYDEYIGKLGNIEEEPKKSKKKNKKEEVVEL